MYGSLNAHAQCVGVCVRTHGDVCVCVSGPGCGGGPASVCHCQVEGQPGEAQQVCDGVAVGREGVQGGGQVGHHSRQPGGETCDGTHMGAWVGGLGLYEPVWTGGWGMGTRD